MGWKSKPNRCPNIAAAAMDVSVFQCMRSACINDSGNDAEEEKLDAIPPRGKILPELPLMLVVVLILL